MGFSIVVANSHKLYEILLSWMKRNTFIRKFFVGRQNFYVPFKFTIYTAAGMLDVMKIINFSQKCVTLVLTWNFYKNLGFRKSVRMIYIDYSSDERSRES